ncbi:MAG: ABC transporter ATP-binding protein [Chloroflexi bacterium]|nr:ABC transporter ATP-binding protein [Chloroflexota bacterium]
MEIKTENLGKSYGKNWALQKVSFTIGGGITALLGPNGAGKTTLLNILATLVQPTRGHVSIGGLDIQHKRQEIRRLLGFLPQEFGLYDSLTAYEFLDYMGLLKGIEHRKQCAHQALEQVGLESYAKRRIGTFSGGMRQRLGLAQALLNRPPILIVDEPTVGLDPAERTRFRQLLIQMGTAHTVILSTHLVEDVLLTAGRVIVLNTGQIRYDGKISEMVKMIQGKVWTTRIAPSDLTTIQQKYIVTNLEASDGSFIVRFLSDGHPSIQAESVSPTLEDAYLFITGRRQ